MKAVIHLDSGSAQNHMQAFHLILSAVMFWTQSNFSLGEKGNLSCGWREDTGDELWNYTKISEQLCLPTFMTSYETHRGLNWVLWWDISSHRSKQLELPFWQRLCTLQLPQLLLQLSLSRKGLASVNCQHSAFRRIRSHSPLQRYAGWPYSKLWVNV